MVGGGGSASLSEGGGICGANDGGSFCFGHLFVATFRESEKCRRSNARRYSNSLSLAAERLDSSLEEGAFALSPVFATSLRSPETAALQTASGMVY